VVQHHADCPFTNLRCKLVRRLAHRRPFLSGVRASGNPGAVQSLTFKQVFEAWEKFINLERPKHKSGPWHATLERVRSYALTFFGPKKIDEITASDFQQFWNWRKENYSRKMPSNGTLGRERTAILALFKYAEKLGHVTSTPNTDAPKAKFRRRPTFTEAEWKKIALAVDKWVADGSGKSTARDRFLAAHYFLFLANTGLRVGELRGLRWGDLRPLETKDGKFVVADVRGKTGRREVVCLKGTGKLLNKVIERRKAELEKLHPDAPEKWAVGNQELVFCHPDGSPIATFKRSFHSLLKFAKVAIDRDGMSRTIYSLRHLYATQRLYEDVSPFLLAQQMGTSVDMLERFYGQTITSSAAAQITKTRKSQNLSSPNTIPNFED
jgi:integrase